MKRISIIAIGIGLFSVCSFKNFELDNMAEIDAYPDSESNKALGIDIIFYDYQSGLSTLIPAIGKEDYKDITWDVFTRSSDKKVFLRLKLNVANPNIRTYKRGIQEYFRQAMRNNLNNHQAQAASFEKAIAMAKTYLSYLGTSKLKVFISKLSPALINKTDMVSFQRSLSRFEETLGKPVSRSLQSKQYYAEIEGLKGNFYMFTYLSDFEKHKSMREVLILQRLPENNWQIVNYRFN